MAGHRPIRALDELIGAERTAQARVMAQKKLREMLVRDVRTAMGLIASGTEASKSKSQLDLSLKSLRQTVQYVGGEVDVFIHSGKRKRPVMASTPQPSASCISL